ncbi:MAG TPA: hypothetical protein VGS16_12985 [Candidatus Dormibacteraeota bacterium]|nr:hypothetical protein [Candidatus Dormibacteraeota bacterium]
MRRLSLIAGIGLVALAFGAGTRVADTREGLIAEVITLLAGLVGVSLVLYGLFAGVRPAARPTPSPPVQRAPAPARPPSARDFALGASGLALAVLLISGMGMTAGWQWGAMGAVVLLPMIIGSAYLCSRFLRAR